MANLSQYGTASVPGVGKVSIFNVGGLLSVFLGLTVLALLWGWAQSTAAKARGVIGGAIPGGAKAQSGPEQAYEIFGYGGGN